MCGVVGQTKFSDDLVKNTYLYLWIAKNQGFQMSIYKWRFRSMIHAAFFLQLGFRHSKFKIISTLYPWYHLVVKNQGFSMSISLSFFKSFVFISLVAVHSNCLSKSSRIKSAASYILKHADKKTCFKRSAFETQSAPSERLSWSRRIRVRVNGSD